MQASLLTDRVVDVAVVLVSFNTAAITRRCLQTLAASDDGLRKQIIVVDNASTDDSAEMLLREFPDIRLIVNSSNVGFGRANNQALEFVTEKYVLLLNTDAFVSADTLRTTVAFMEETPECGVLGVKLLGEDGSLQPSARYFPTPWNMFLRDYGLERLFPGTQRIDDMDWPHDSVRECDWVPGCYFLIRKTLIDQICLFDPRYFLYYEEIDFCFRAKQKGWQVWFYPHTMVVHVGGESSKTQGELSAAGAQLERLRYESEMLYFRKHYGFSAVFLDVALVTLGESLKILSRLLQERTSQGLVALGLIWSAFRQTRAGARPAR
jgi:GT2 family glycosyltransferase